LSVTGCFRIVSFVLFMLGLCSVRLIAINYCWRPAYC